MSEFKIAFLIRYAREPENAARDALYDSYRVIVRGLGHQQPSIERARNDQLGESWDPIAVSDPTAMRVYSAVMIRLANGTVDWGKSVHQFMQNAWSTAWTAAMSRHATKHTKRMPPIIAPTDNVLLPSGWTKSDNLIVIDLGVVPLPLVMP